MRSVRPFFVSLLFVLLVALPPALAAQDKPVSSVPVPQFQGDFFGEMPRVFCTIFSVDPKTRIVTIKQDNGGKIVQVPIKEDTELHFRDSWGELTDYFPGQHVMLFLYVDEDKNWTYPRAIQDEIHVSARHGWFARVTKIETSSRLIHTTRDEKNEQGQVTKTIEKDIPYAPEVKVWKSDTPGSVETLKVGDEIIPQLVEREGKLIAVELFDRKGDDAVRAMQDARHRKDQERLGLPASVNDIEVISGSLVASVAWSGSERAKELKPGEVVTIVPSDGAKPFAAALSSTQPLETRQRIQFVVNARVASRLALGQSLRIFLPGTGPALPTGRAGIPMQK